MECGYYLRVATIAFKVWQHGATIQGRRLFKGGDYSRAASDQGNTVIVLFCFFFFCSGT